MHITVRGALIGSIGLFLITLLHACVETRRGPTTPSAVGVELSGQSIGWECLRTPEANPGNITGPWTFPQVSAGCPAIAVTPSATAAPVVGAVLNLRATVTGSTVRLDWDYPPNEFVNGFQLEAGSGPGLANLAVFQLPSAPPFVIVTGVPNGAYYVRVRGTGGPLGPPSNEIIVRVGVSCAGPPGPPVNFSHNVAGNSVFLLWGAPNVGDPPVTYVVEAGTATGLANLVVFDTGSLATSLTVGAPNGVYFTRLRAINACGTSGPSNERVIAVGVTPPTTTTISGGGSTTTTTVGPTTTTTTIGGGGSTTTTSSTTTTTSMATTTTTTSTVGISFSAVWANMNGCLTCHNNSMIVTDGNNRFSNQSTAYNFAVARSNAGNPDGSTFLVKVSGGASHGGGAQWPFGSAAYNTAKSWMTSGQAQ